jgi:hypothetical protein
MVFCRDHGMGYDDTIKHTIKKGCLSVLASAGKCQMKTKKARNYAGLGVF